MKFPVYVNLVVIGVENYQPEGLEVGLIKTSDGLSLAEAKLEHGEKSSDIAVQLVKKYIDMESFDRNLLLLSSVGFVDAPDRYKKVNRADVFHQDIVLIYKVVIPLNASLNNGMEWVNFEPIPDENTPEQRSKLRNLVAYANNQTETFCKDHLNLIDMAFHDG
jgi:hypothetical protein